MNPDTPTIVDALRAEAERQSRAAGRLAEGVMNERAQTGRDIRSSAVKIVEVLGTGQTLSRVADGLESGTLLLIPAALVEVPRPLDEGAPELPADPPAEPAQDLLPLESKPAEGDDDDGPVTEANVVDILTRLEREEAPDATS